MTGQPLGMLLFPLKKSMQEVVLDNIKKSIWRKGFRVENAPDKLEEASVPFLRCCVSVAVVHLMSAFVC